LGLVYTAPNPALAWKSPMGRGIKAAAPVGKRETNGDRFARGLPPRRQAVTRSSRALRPRGSGTAAPPSCDNPGTTNYQIAGGGSCDCQYEVQCGSQAVGQQADEPTQIDGSFAACVQYCDNSFSCSYAVFDNILGDCTLLEVRDSSNSNPQYDTATLVGPCSGPCSSHK